MNPIFQALGQGYSAQQIISFLGKSLSHIAPSINKARSAGYRPEQILGFLSKSFESENRTGLSESERHAVNRRADAERTKFGLKAVGTAIAAPAVAFAARAALSRALPAAFQGIANPNAAMPGPQHGAGVQPHGTTPPSIQNAPNQNAPALQPTLTTPQAQNPVVPTSLTPSNNPNIPQTPEIQQPEGIPLKKETEFEKTQRRLDDFFSGRKDTLSDEPEEVREKPITKNETVLSPHGMGEVKEIRNGKAIIEIDGKKHQVNEDELIASDLPKKDLADLYDDFVSGIEKESGQEVSRNVNWAGYDPKTNELAYRPHAGKLYVYDDISPEDVEELMSILSTRKTSGENFIGAWSEGSKSPIGAAMFRLIQKLQKERGGKGNEYKNRFETLYDALGIASEASKKKHAALKRKKKT